MANTGASFVSREVGALHCACQNGSPTPMARRRSYPLPPWRHVWLTAGIRLILTTISSLQYLPQSNRNRLCRCTSEGSDARCSCAAPDRPLCSFRPPTVQASAPDFAARAFSEYCPVAQSSAPAGNLLVSRAIYLHSSKPKSVHFVDGDGTVTSTLLVKCGNQAAKPGGHPSCETWEDFPE